MRSNISQAQTGRPYEFLIPAIVLGIGLILAGTTFGVLRSHAQERDQDRFQRDSARFSALFTSAVEQHVQSLSTVRAFVSANLGITRWNFSAFATQALAGNPGFSRFFWVPIINHDDRARYETQLQKDGLFGLRIRQRDQSGAIAVAAEHPLYRPVTFAEPFTGTSSTIGLDLSEDTLLKPLFETALSHGAKAAVSIPIEHSVLDQTSGPAVIVAFPLLPLANAEPSGFVLGVLRFQALLDYIGMGNTSALAVAIAFNDDAYPRRLVYASQDQGKGATSLAEWLQDRTFRQEIPFDVAGRQFVLGLGSSYGGSLRTHAVIPLSAGLLVLFLAALLAQNIHATISAKYNVERSVQQRTAALHAANVALEAEIEQRRAAELALRAAWDKAESAMKAKSAFLATMSHELRTPLNSIIGFAGLLAQEDLPRASNTKIDEYVTHIHESGIKLLHLINELLEISQMDAGQVRLEEDSIALGDMIESVTQRSAATTPGLSIQTQIADTLPLVRADPRRLQKTLHHLVSNATKFTPNEGTVKIEAGETDGGLVYIAVADNGIGIPKGQEHRIFEPFVQLDSNLSRKTNGAGLGLAYVKRVAELHGARLDITSKLGAGTRVSLTFPLNRVVRSAKVAS